MRFEPFQVLSAEDINLAARLLTPHGASDGLGLARLYEPDLVIKPNGLPYLYRWRLTPYAGEAQDRHGNTYLHVQVASDPDRPLHDHPWDNTSLILAGGYNELYDPLPRLPGEPCERPLRRGDFVYRKAEVAHRLILPPEFDYTMTQFSTGCVRREWGFWTPEGWLDSHEFYDRRQA